MSLTLVLKVFTGILCLWLICTSSAADSVPFPKESMTTIRDDRTFTDSYVLAFINYTYRRPDGSEKDFSAEKARYGEGRILNVQGYLVHVTKENNISDNTACTEDIRDSRGNLLPSRPHSWVALIRRGGCTFDQKIKHVFLHGAAGAIIYNEEPSNSLEKMKILDKDRNITAVFTFKWIGEEMARIADDGYPVWVSISEGTRGQRPLTNINKTSVLFVSISFIILMVISLIWLIFYYIQRFRYLQSKDQQSRHLCSVAKRIIMKIPTKSGKIEDKESDNDCCAICIENYKHTDCIRILPCRHEFHKNCVDPWLLEQRTCPMCKLDVLKYYGFVFLGSEESIVELDLDMEINDNGIVQRRQQQISTEIHNENEHNSISLSTTLQSLNSGLYIYGNQRQRSVSLQPNDISIDSKLLKKSISTSNTELVSNRLPKNQSIHNNESMLSFNNESQHRRNSNFLRPNDGSYTKKRQRSKSADACYLKLSSIGLASHKNLNDKKNLVGEFSSGSSFRCVENDDKILLTNRTIATNNSDPPTLLTIQNNDLQLPQCHIQIQIEEPSDE